MSRSSKYVFFGAGAVALLAAAVFVLPTWLGRSDFRSGLAKALNENSSDFVLNVPPAAGLLPGSVFLQDGSRLIPIRRSLPKDEGITPGTLFEIGWSELADARGKSGAGAGSLGALFGDAETARVEVRVTQCRVLDMDLAVITTRLKAKEVTDLAADESKHLAVVVRAYEGILEARLRRTRNASADAWKALQERAATTVSPNVTVGQASIKVDATNKNELVVSWLEPVVFACIWGT